MRALLRTVTGSPASSKGKTRQSRGQGEHYSVSDIAGCWGNIKSTLAASSSQYTSASNSDHASTSQTSKQKLEAISQELDSIVEALVNEQASLASDDAGPCLEYVLTNNVFTNIAQAAITDTPEGLLGVVISVFDNLVILLGDAFVTFGHRSLNYLLHECIVQEDASKVQHEGQEQQHSNTHLKLTGVAHVYEEELASLACSLCSRIKTQPDLLPLFFHDKRLSYRSKNPTSQSAPTIHVHQDDTPLSTSPLSSTLSPRPPLSASSSQTSLCSSTSLSSSPMASPAASSQPTTVQSRQYTFLVFDFLIRLLHRHGRTGELARTGLLFIIDLSMSNAKMKVPAGTSHKDGYLHAMPILGSELKKVISPVIARTKSKRRRTHGVIGQSDRLSLLSYIEDSDFADVLGAGLGASLAILPSQLYVPVLGLQEHTEVTEHAQSNASQEEAHNLSTMHEHGIAISTDPEVQESLKLFVAIINFATDVTRKAPPSVTTEDRGTSSAADMSIASTSDKMQSLVTSIRASFGNVFLRNAVLPRLIDAASPTAEDAAIVAVLVYIDTLLRTLEQGNPLFEETLAALLSRQTGDMPGSHDKSAMRDNVRRILGYALSSPNMPLPKLPDTPTSLHTTLAASMCLCALRVIHTMLERADWASLELFTTTPAVGCTNFPYAPPDDQDQDFSYPEDDESDEENFIYPDEDDHRQSLNQFTASVATFKAPAQQQQPPDAKLDLFFKMLETGTNTPSSMSGKQASPISGVFQSGHRSSLSRHSSKSSMDTNNLYTVTSTNSMGFGEYLKQAETAIQHDQSFIRGSRLLARSEDERTTSTTNKSSSSHKVGSILQLGDVSLNSTSTSHRSDATTAPSDTYEGPEEDRMVQHKLQIRLGLLSQLHMLLATFFINDPAINLSLTQVLAKLAVCPYRCLEDWLLHVGKGGVLETLQDLHLLSRAIPSLEDPYTSKAKHQDNDHTSKVKDWLRHNRFRDNVEAERYYADPSTSKNEHPSILASYAALLEEVTDSHRHQIKDFDRLFQVRRQNMLFVDDLADAMDGGYLGTDTPQQEIASFQWSSPFASMTRVSGGSSSPTHTKSRHRVSSGASERDYINSVSPYATHLRETASKQVVIRIAVQEKPEGMDANAQRPEIQRFWSASTSDSGEEEPQVPHRPSLLSPEAGMGRSSSLMLLSDLKSPMGPPKEPDPPYREVPVNLSKYLDNLVILEESLKELLAIIVVRMRIGIDPIH